MVCQKRTAARGAIAGWPMRELAAAAVGLFIGLVLGGICLLPTLVRLREERDALEPDGLRWRHVAAHLSAKLRWASAGVQEGWHLEFTERLEGVLPAGAAPPSIEWLVDTAIEQAAEREVATDA